MQAWPAVPALAADPLSSASGVAAIAAWEEKSNTSAGTAVSSVLQQWEAAWDVQRNRWYFADRRTGTASWKRPLGCTIRLPSGPPVQGGATAAEHGLPAGWEANWDQTHGAYYYFNRQTNQRTWRKPRKLGVLARAWKYLTPRGRDRMTKVDPSKSPESISLPASVLHSRSSSRASSRAATPSPAPLPRIAPQVLSEALASALTTPVQPPRLVSIPRLDSVHETGDATAADGASDVGPSAMSCVGSAVADETSPPPTALQDDFSSSALGQKPPPWPSKLAPLADAPLPLTTDSPFQHKQPSQQVSQQQPLQQLPQQQLQLQAQRQQQQTQQPTPQQQKQDQDAPPHSPQQVPQLLLEPQQQKHLQQRPLQKPQQQQQQPQRVASSASIAASASGSVEGGLHGEALGREMIPLSSQDDAACASRSASFPAAALSSTPQAPASAAAPLPRARASDMNGAPAAAGGYAAATATLPFLGPPVATALPVSTGETPRHHANVALEPHRDADLGKDESLTKVESLGGDGGELVESDCQQQAPDCAADDEVTAAAVIDVPCDRELEEERVFISDVEDDLDIESDALALVEVEALRAGLLLDTAERVHLLTSNHAPSQWLEGHVSAAADMEMGFDAIAKRVIAPATAARACSFVELVATGSQRPAWFVSHSWDGSARAVEACLLQHAEDRRLAYVAGAAYWLDVCALTRRELKKLGRLRGGHSPERSREADGATAPLRAQALALGTLSVLAPVRAHSSRAGGDGIETSGNTPHLRPWCAYEAHLALTAYADREPQHLHDVYIACDGVTETLAGAGATIGGLPSFASVGVSDGLAERDMPLPLGGASARELQAAVIASTAALRDVSAPAAAAAAACKQGRERHFFTYFAKNARSTDESGSFLTWCSPGSGCTCSGVSDAGGAADVDATAVAATLGANSAVWTWRRMLEAGEDMVAQSAALASSRLLRLHLGLQDLSSALTDVSLQTLAGSLPPTLRMLDLRLGGGALGDVGLDALAVALKRLPLRELALALPRSPGVSGASVRAIAAALPSQLRALSLDFSECLKVDGASIFSCLVAALPPELQRLGLALRRCPRVCDVRFVETLPPSLTTLWMYLQGCDAIGFGFTEALRGKIPESVLELVVDLSGCALRDRGLQAIGNALPRGLEVLDLDVSDSPELSMDLGIRPLASYLPGTLRQLAIGFKDCPGIPHFRAECILKRVLQEADTQVTFRI
eukprot:TRINITY_DN1836_c1_g1_i1.p1 TRINITY_DN1836_c1_g1~~TRINITY_DN1836_c1_g1_i1.p1  ORF type:complete len:1223 (-),score=274.88 TRINITY_DN1836_c1_g1_i1:118-3786(-)